MLAFKFFKTNLKLSLLMSIATIVGCSQSAPANSDPVVRAEVQVTGNSKPQTERKVEATDEPANQQEGHDWPVFLGPHGTGESDETGLLDEWPKDGPQILWEKRIGKGYSSPSILGNLLVVHHRLRDHDVIECLKADDGTPIWKCEYDTDFEDPYGYNNGPRCSPVLTKNRCYTFGAQGRLVCLNLETGDVIWEHETAKEWTVPKHFFGAGCTPILEGDLLIVLVGGQPDSGVVAFNAETGKTVWESVGKKTWDGANTDQPGQKFHWTDEEMVVSYSSPIVATIHGKKHLFCLVRQGLVSLDPADGRVRFKYWFRARVHESVNAARPVVIDDQVFLSAAYETGAALLTIRPDGESYDVAWRKKRGMSTHWSTAIHRDGCIYGFSGRHEGEAMLQCIDRETGDLVWETNGYEGPLADLRTTNTGEIADATGNPVTFFGRGSKTAVDGKYIMLGERGILVLAKLSRDKFEQISRATYKQIRYPAWAAPVISRGRLYLRSEDHLICLDVAKPDARTP